MSVFSEIDTMKNIDVEEEENVMVLPRSDNSVSTNEPLTPEVLSEPSKEEKVKTPEVSSEEKAIVDGNGLTKNDKKRRFRRFLR